MALTNELPIITSNLKTGFGVYGTADPFNASSTYFPYNNGAANPPGSLYFIPSPSQGGNLTLASATGYASGLWVRYVLYKSTANPAMVGGPAVVYYTDETYTTVTGVFSEGNPAATGNANSIAGWLLPNTGTVAGVGVGTAVSATILNNGGAGSYVFIGLLGFIPSCSVVAATAIGDALIGAAGNFTTGRVAAGTAPTNKILGWAKSAIAAGVADVEAQVMPF